MVCAETGRTASANPLAATPAMKPRRLQRAPVAGLFAFGFGHCSSSLGARPASIAKHGFTGP